jgi:hypothetical protein
MVSTRGKGGHPEGDGHGSDGEEERRHGRDKAKVTMPLVMPHRGGCSYIGNEVFTSPL